MWRLPWLVAMSVPIVSMKSISPHAGQLTVEMLSPRAQIAGQRPLPVGICARASKRPYCCEKRPWVRRRALVYLHVPYEHGYADAPWVVAVMTRLPPWTTAFCVPLV